jgi:hypothetical protein
MASSSTTTTRTHSSSSAPPKLTSKSNKSCAALVTWVQTQFKMAELHLVMAPLQREVYIVYWN